MDEIFARGHEIWLEHEYEHTHIGERVECKICLGDKMKVDVAGARKILSNRDRVRSFIFDPANKRHNLDIKRVGGCLATSFIPKIAGYHTVVAEYDIGVLNLSHPGWEGPKYFYQYAKTITPIGHEFKGYHLITGQGLEIVPLEMKQYFVWDEVVLSVLYDGLPLSDATLSATCSKGGDDRSIEKKTNADGMVTIELVKQGNWMFLVRYRDSDKSVKDEWDEKVTTATLTFMDIH